MTKRLVWALAGSLCAGGALAQPAVQPISGTVTVAGFTAASVGTPIAVTSSGVTGTLPAGATVIASNVGALNTAYCALGASATTSHQPIPPGGWFAFARGAATQLTCITSTSTTTVNMVGGAGLPAGSGGGAGGSGGGSAVTSVDGGIVTQGAVADAAYTSGSGTVIAILKGIYTKVAAALSVTQSGTWTVQPGNTANTTAWKTDGSAVTQPTSAADGSSVTLGAKADAKSTATDTTSITIMSVLKQVSASVQAAAASLVTIATNSGSPIPTQAGVGVNIGNIGGIDAPGATITGQPVLTGGRAQSAPPTATTDGKAIPAGYTLDGKAITAPYANPENYVSGVITSAMTGTTSTSLVAAPAAGLRNYITACTFSNSHATVGTDIILQDGSGGTAIWNVPAAALYGGAHIVFPTPLRQPTTATALYVANVTTGASTKVACSGYKGV